MRDRDIDDSRSLAPGDPHYRAYVGPPDRFDFMSATQFALLFALGLRENDKVLDVGCGSLRLGRLLIPFLRPGCYFGIEPNEWLIEEGIRRELGSDVLQTKEPTFAARDDFAAASFGESFPFVIAQSIATHCGIDLFRKLVGGVAEALAENGKFLFSYVEAPPSGTTPGSGEEATGWYYPECVSFRRSRVHEMVAEAGLFGRMIPWHHPAATWYVAAKTRECLPTLREASLLTGSVVATPERADSLPRRAPRNPYVWSTSHREALARGSSRGVGETALQTRGPLRAASLEQLAFTYTAGPAGVRPGGSLRIAFRHICPWSPPQTNDPAGEGFVTAVTSDGQSLEVRGWNEIENRQDHFLATFPWQHCIEIRTGETGLVEGDQIEIVYGDRSQGGPGARVQPFEDPRCRFRPSVDCDGSNRHLPAGEDLEIEIAGGDADRLRIIAPSQCRVDEHFALIVRAEDEFGNRAQDWSEDVTVRLGGPAGPILHAEEPLEEGWTRIQDLLLDAPGVHRLYVESGSLTARSNPIRALGSREERLSTWWGEIHGHSAISDGRGSVEEYYDYAEAQCGLDVAAVTDHDFLISDEDWETSKRITNRRYRPGEFVTLQAFEWSGSTDMGGDHNVYFRGHDPPLFRSRLFYDYRNDAYYHGPTPAAHHVEDLYQQLLARHTPDEVQVIPHFGGRPASPRWHRPELERLIEVFNEHHRCESWARQFLEHGYRLGVVGGGDDHIGRPGHGFLPPDRPLDQAPRSGHGLVAFLAEDLTRDGIFDALLGRRVYATTGERILLDVRIDGHPMGAEIEVDGFPEIEIEVDGTAPVDRIEIFRNGRLAAEHVPPGGSLFDEEKYLEEYPDVAATVDHGLMPDGYFHFLHHGHGEGRTRFERRAGDQPTERVTCSWIDDEAERDVKNGAPAAELAYHVRVVQEDGGIARSSPIWVQL